MRIRHLILLLFLLIRLLFWRMRNEVTAKDIRDTLFHMPANKAHGPNGYSIEFFNASWSIVGEEVVADINELFVSGLLLKEVNATILALVPNKVNPFAMGISNL